MFNVDVSNATRCSTESRGLIPSGFEPLPYLKNVYLYLQTLASIVNKSCNQSTGEIYTLKGDQHLHKLLLKS